MADCNNASPGLLNWGIAWLTRVISSEITLRLARFDQRSSNADNRSHVLFGFVNVSGRFTEKSAECTRAIISTAISKELVSSSSESDARVSDISPIVCVRANVSHKIVLSWTLSRLPLRLRFVCPKRFFNRLPRNLRKFALNKFGKQDLRKFVVEKDLASFVWEVDRDRVFVLMIRVTQLEHPS